MPAFSESIVREFFELHGFLVCQQRKDASTGRPTDEEIDFFVTHPRPAATGSALPAVLTPDDLPCLVRAVVVVKGWHTETFGASVLAHAPEIFRFVEEKTLQRAAKFFGPDSPFTKVLVVPALPRAAEARAEALEVMRTKGVDAVIPFQTILRDLIDTVEVNRNYSKSDLLQTIRILKNYEFFKEDQLELFKPKRRASRPDREAGSDKTV
jgi:hypothetical protein